MCKLELNKISEVIKMNEAKKITKIIEDAIKVKENKSDKLEEKSDKKDTDK